MSNVKCQMSCQKSNVKCQRSNVQCQKLLLFLFLTQAAACKICLACKTCSAMIPATEKVFWFSLKSLFIVAVFGENIRRRVWELQEDFHHVRQGFDFTFTFFSKLIKTLVSGWRWNRFNQGTGSGHEITWWIKQFIITRITQWTESNIIKLNQLSLGSLRELN